MAFLISLLIEFWFLTAAIVLGLVIPALFGPKRLGRFRWLALGMAVPMAMPLALAGLYHASKWQLTRTLSDDEIVDGQLLYAGSVVRFRDREHTRISFIKLPRVTEIDRIPFTGTVGFSSGGGENPGSIYGTLAADHLIDGWPCARGKIGIRWGNKLLSCELATARTFFDFEVPAGSTVHGDWKSWSFDLPPDQGLAIKVLSTTVAAGGRIEVTSDGRLKRIRLKEGQTMIVHGVPLRADIEIVEDVLVGEIAESFAVTGEQRPAGTRVSFDFAEPGWPCEGEKVRLPHEGSLWSCRLTSEHAFFGYDLPGGTTVLCGGERHTWLLILPPDKGLAIKAMSTTVPAGAALRLTDMGGLWKIGGAGQSVVVHGVPLEGEIYISGGAAKGKIAESLEIAGKQEPIGADVKIDLMTGAISLDPPPDCARVCPN